MTWIQKSCFRARSGRVVTLLGVLGCSDAAPELAPSAGAVMRAEPAGCAALRFPAQDGATLFELGQRIEPGEEREVCALQQVGPEDIWLNASDVVMSRGSHHGLLWLTDYETLPERDRQGEPIELGKVIPCPASAFGRFSVIRPLAGSQGIGNITAPGVFPPDVAERIPAHAYVVTNLHMLNSTDTPIDACLKVAVHGVPAAQVAQEAGTLFFYHPYIALAPQSHGEARMACPITRDIQLRTAVSHMHARGVGYRASWLDGAPFAEGTHTLQTLYETTDWETPADAVWPEPLQLRAGHFIDYTCEYNNDEARDVAQGLATSDEMCMFIGAYWPYERAMSFCGNNLPSFPIGSGDQDGSAFMRCVLERVQRPGATQACGADGCTDYAARVALQACFRDACPAVGQHASAYMGCLQQNAGECRARCEGSDDCLTRCLNEEKCQALTTKLAATHCE